MTASQDQVVAAPSEAELLQTALNHVGVGVASLRADGSIITSNDGFFDMLRRAGMISLEFVGGDQR